MATILVVDDEIGIRELLSEILIDEGFDVRLAENAAAARRIRNEMRPDLVLLDIWMPDTDGISLLKEWHSAGLRDMPVIMMSGHATIDTAVEATRFGASDFLEKPVALQKLVSTIQKTLQRDTANHSAELSLGNFSGVALMGDASLRFAEIAKKNRLIFLKGMSGVLVKIFASGLQAKEKSCQDFSALSSTLTVDALEKMQGGLLFVSDLSLLSKMQQINLQFLLDHLEKTDICLLVGSSKTPAQLKASGLDEKTLNKLTTTWFSLPSLDEHRAKLPLIAKQLLAVLVHRKETPASRFADAASEMFCSVAWSQDFAWDTLYALIKNLGLSAVGGEITAADVRRALSHCDTLSAKAHSDIYHLPLREARDQFERAYLEYHWQKENGNMVRIAENTGLERTHLYRRYKQLETDNQIATKATPSEI